MLETSVHVLFIRFSPAHLGNNSGGKFQSTIQKLTLYDTPKKQAHLGDFVHVWRYLGIALGAISFGASQHAAHR